MLHLYLPEYPDCCFGRLRSPAAQIRFSALALCRISFCTLDRLYTTAIILINAATGMITGAMPHWITPENPFCD
jgi:hypothetical protein